MDSCDDTFALTRARITQVIEDAMSELEDASDDEAAYRQASWIVEALRVATNEAAQLRLSIASRIKESGQLSIAKLGEKIGLSKARTAEMMKAAAKAAQRKDAG